MQTLEPTLDAANQAIDHARRFSGRVVTLIKHVPDDKLCWRPSATSKSPLQLVLHCAASNIFMKNVIEANDKVPATPEDFFREVAEAEAQPATREEAVAMLEQSTEDLCRAIASLDSAALDSTPASPFGPLPVRVWIHEGGTHLASHYGQIAYLQTIWGDLDNHMG